MSARVAAAREAQEARFTEIVGPQSMLLNAHVEGELLDRIATPDDPGKRLLVEASERMGLTARGYHRVLRVARTLADLDGADGVTRSTSPRRSPTAKRWPENSAPRHSARSLFTFR